MAKVYHASLWGLRKEKYINLGELDVNTTPWEVLEPSTPHYLFSPQDTNLEEEYLAGVQVNDLVPTNSMGITTGNDTQLIAFTTAEILQEFTEKRFFQDVAYRPFDTRKLFYKPAVLARARTELMRHFHHAPNFHEHSYSRLKGQPLSLTPMYLQLDEQIKGLIRLLSIALRVLNLIEFVVRRELAQRGEELSGLYAGNPKRRTARPSAELLLYAFREITLSIIQLAGQVIYHLTELSQLQRAILQLLGVDETIYTSLAGHSWKLNGV